ncbi:MAG: hypothetical protein A2W31_17945 [Planctomycetes bacterium RBG_16_64_10]|nr:MAG: hypothetical protein A2W31_17945 [Planctomycetes bacterium RBG_16_64_10]
MDHAPSAAGPAATGATAAAGENQACFICHVNYQDEPLVTVHAAQNIGCAKCHGESHPHRSDENNTTPPDIMYPAAAIAPACRKCHETHDVPPEQVVLRWLERCPAKKDPQELVCTDCHGRHRLTTRTVRWDKKTGQLMRTDQARGADRSP